MQTLSQKKIILFSIFFSFLIQNVFSNTSEALFKEADNLFNNRKYKQAMKLYEEIRSEKRLFSEQSLLKMAFISEKVEKNDAKALFYLSLCYEKNKSSKVRGHILSLAKKNDLQGYDYGDETFFSEIYANYRFIFFIVIILGNVSLLLWLWNRVEKDKRNRTLIYNFTTLGVSLMLMILLNWRWQSSEGIVLSKSAHIFNAPSAGADVIGKIPDGSKLNIGEDFDIWKQIYWNNDTYYVRKMHIGIVK